MNRLVTMVAAFACVWLAPMLVLASPPAGGEHGSQGGGISWFGGGWLGRAGADGKTAFAVIVLNFVVLLMVLNKILFKNLRSSNAEASDAIRLELERATKARSEAEALYREYETKLQALESEVADIRATARETAQAEYTRIIADAHEQAEKIKQAAVRAGEREAARRRAELEQEIIDSALARAETAIRSTFGPTDQRRLVDAWIDEVSKTDINKQAGVN
jgi:F0F1-type ATP synthase membrane subunit b/b'